MDREAMKSPVLMFSIGLNGFDKKWEPCIVSQREYSRKHGYDYCIVNHLPFAVSTSESAWLKIPLMLKALEKGYEWVFFADADCMVNINMPKITLLEAPGKYVYMALGHTNRFNAGVFIVKNNIQSRKFLQDILLICDYPVLNKKERCLYENGHVIHLASRSTIIKIIDRKWNNATEPLPDDYIRHYTGAIMSRYYPFEREKDTKENIIDQYVQKGFFTGLIIRCKNSIRFCFKICLNIIRKPLYKKLLIYTAECEKKYPCFARNNF